MRGAGRLVTGDARGDFQIPAVAQVLRDAGPPETVIGYFMWQAGITHPPLDHLERGLTRHSAAQQQILPAALSGRPEQRSLPIVVNAGGIDIVIHIGLADVVCRHHEILTAFFM